MVKPQHVLLVGGHKGLGADVKVSLEASGQHVYAVSRSSSASLWRLDLTWPEEQIRLHVREFIAMMGGQLDALIVCSGAGAYLRPTVSDARVKELMQINFHGPTCVFRACQRALLRSRGKAIMVTSTAARPPGSGGLSYYAGTKGAMHSWVTSEGRRQIKHGVSLCAVAPGFLETPMTEEMAPALRKKTEAAIPAGRYGKGYEVATLISDILWWSNWVSAGRIYEASGGA